MTSLALINNAVLNSSATGYKGLADRLFAACFNRLVYAQIWEDPLIDLAALDLAPGARVLTIASGGCNALAYLMHRPSAVHVVDLNGAHLAMLAIKRAAIAGLPDHREVLAFLGDAADPANAERYTRWIAPRLDEVSRTYWETPDWRGRPRYTAFTRHAYRHGLLGRSIGFAHRVVRLLGGDLAKVAEARDMDEQRRLFERHVAPVFDHGLVRWLANRPLALYSLGIPPSLFEILRQDAKRQGLTLAELFRERLRHLACDFPLFANCFAGQAFARRYDTRHDSALPMYLQRAYYDSIRSNLDKLYPHHAGLTDVLRDMPMESLDAYLFLDAQDWMDRAQLNDLWWEVTRTAAPGARVVFRSGGSQSPLEGRLPPDLLAAWRTDPEHNARLHRWDRSALYGGTHLYIRN